MGIAGSVDGAVGSFDSVGGNVDSVFGNVKELLMVLMGMGSVDSAV